MGYCSNVAEKNTFVESLTLKHLQVACLGLALMQEISLQTVTIFCDWSDQPVDSERDHGGCSVRI